MKELPEGEIDEASAFQLDALKSLLYEGDAEERAQNFKSQANDNFREKKFKEALQFYTQGLGDLSPELHEETKRTLWCNRAACHLELGNYRSCIRDCASVLTPSEREVPEEDKDIHQKTNLKALFRCAKALIALERLDDAQDALQRYHHEGGQKDAGVQKVEAALKDKITYRNKIRADAKERERRLQESDATLSQAIKSLRLALPKGWSPDTARKACPAEITPPHFDPESSPASSSSKIPLSKPEQWSPIPAMTPLIFPIFLLRPLATPPTRDLILTFHQDVTFGDQLDAFNAQNAGQARSPGEEVVYAVTKSGRILKVGRKLTLKKIIEAAAQKLPDGKMDGLDLVEGWCLEFYIVPKGDEEASWIQEMKKRLKA